MASVRYMYRLDGRASAFLTDRFSHVGEFSGSGNPISIFTLFCILNYFTLYFSFKYWVTPSTLSGAFMTATGVLLTEALGSKSE